MTPSEYVREQDDQVSKEISTQVKRTPKINVILNKDNVDITVADQTTLTTTFIKRYETQDKVVRNPLDDVRSLKQGITEDLFDYYGRGNDLLSRLEVEDVEDYSANPTASYILESLY